MGSRQNGGRRKNKSEAFLAQKCLEVVLVTVSDKEGDASDFLLLDTTIRPDTLHRDHLN